MLHGITSPCHSRLDQRISLAADRVFCVQANRDRTSAERSRQTLKTPRTQKGNRFCQRRIDRLSATAIPLHTWLAKVNRLSYRKESRKESGKDSRKKRARNKTPRAEELNKRSQNTRRLCRIRLKSKIAASPSQGDPTSVSTSAGLSCPSLFNRFEWLSIAARNLLCELAPRALD